MSPPDSIGMRNGSAAAAASGSSAGRRASSQPTTADRREPAPRPAPPRARGPVAQRLDLVASTRCGPSSTRRRARARRACAAPGRGRAHARARRRPRGAPRRRRPSARRRRACVSGERKRSSVHIRLMSVCSSGSRAQPRRQLGRRRCARTRPLPEARRDDHVALASCVDATASDARVGADRPDRLEGVEAGPNWPSVPAKRSMRSTVFVERQRRARGATGRSRAPNRSRAVGWVGGAMTRRGVTGTARRRLSVPGRAGARPPRAHPAAQRCAARRRPSSGSRPASTTPVWPSSCGPVAAGERDVGRDVVAAARRGRSRRAAARRARRRPAGSAPLRVDAARCARAGPPSSVSGQPSPSSSIRLRPCHVVTGSTTRTRSSRARTARRTAPGRCGVRGADLEEVHARTCRPARCSDARARACRIPSARGPRLARPGARATCSARPAATTRNSASAVASHRRARRPAREERDAASRPCPRARSPYAGSGRQRRAATCRCCPPGRASGPRRRRSRRQARAALARAVPRPQRVARRDVALEHEPRRASTSVR